MRGAMGFLILLLMLAFSGQASLDIQAQNGAKYEVASGCLTFLGPVHVKDKEWTLTCHKLKVSFNGLKTAKVLEALGHVQVQGPHGKLVGDHLVYDLEQQKGTIRGKNVRFDNAHFTFQTPVGLHYDHRMQRAESLGPGSLFSLQKKKRLQAKKFILFCPAWKIHTIWAQNHVLFESPSHCAQAHCLTYHHASQCMDLQGHVRLMSLFGKTKTFISGNQARINLATSQVTMADQGKVGFSCLIQNQDAKDAGLLFSHPQS